MAQAECPSCDSNVNVGTIPKVGHRVTCPTCDAALEVVWLNPVELDWLYEDDEDYEYDYDEDESDYETLRY